MLFKLILLLSLFSGKTFASIPVNLPVFPPCNPESEPVKPVQIHSSVTPSAQVCREWGPRNSSGKGSSCCEKVSHGTKIKKLNRCLPLAKSYCHLMTEEQRKYGELASSGKLGDLLSFLTQEMGKYGEQAYCTVGNGFLANGRRLIPTPENRLLVRNPDSCLDFGTDAMVGMLEWLGRELRKDFPDERYSWLRLMIGDISPPRGGCLIGNSGRRKHASHTSGQDADVGFLSASPGRQPTSHFIHHFEPGVNWKFLKKVFKNPFACVKVVFLDRQHIRALSSHAKKEKDPEWPLFSKFVRHMKGHKNHFHIRVGKGPGPAGCTPDARPDLEFEDGDSIEFDESSILGELKARQRASIQ